MPVVLATELKKLFIESGVNGCMTQNFFFSAHHGFNCLSFIWATDRRVLENNVKTKQDQATKMLRQAGYSMYVMYRNSLQASPLI